MKRLQSAILNLGRFLLSLAGPRKGLVRIVLSLVFGFILFSGTGRNPALAQYPGVTVQFESAQYTVVENGGNGTIIVRLSQPSNEEVKVDYETSNGSATAGEDYDTTSGTLSFPSGVTEQTFNVVVKRDLKIEDSETVLLKLKNPKGASLGLAEANMTIYDMPPVLTLTPANSAICAGGLQTLVHQTTVTATLTDGINPFVGETVNFSTSAGSIDSSSGTTDSNGQVEITLTSNNTASEGFELYEATLTATAGDASGNGKVEFQAPELLLSAYPKELDVGEISNLNMSLTWSAIPVGQHNLAWAISRIWDGDDNLIYEGVGEIPSGFGIIKPEPSAQTDENGYGSGVFLGTSAGTVEIEVADLNVVYVLSGGKPKGNDSVKTKKGGNLADIYNGQFGNKVEEDKQETVGAFTVANLNDTNGDDIPDNKQKSVKVTVKGREEMDLIQFVLHRPKPDGENKVKVTVVSGAIKFWQASTKEKEIETLEFSPANLPLTMWIEATDVSKKSVRDIEIKVEYKTESETLKATGVWAKQTAVEHNTMSADDLFKKDTWKDMPDPPKQMVNLVGGTGLRPLSDIGLRNSIVIEFTMLPAGISKEPNIKFDITRQIEGKEWIKNGNEVEVRTERPPFSEQRAEEASDDPKPDIDESTNPDTKDRMYVMDGPGVSTKKATDEVCVWRFNFKEFIRVNFNNTKPSGNTEEGSRCSDYYLWHVRHYLQQKKGDDWTRSTDQNDIGLKDIEIGDFK